MKSHQDELVYYVVFGLDKSSAISQWLNQRLNLTPGVNQRTRHTFKVIAFWRVGPPLQYQQAWVGGLKELGVPL